MTSFYIAADLDRAIDFIKANTNWEQVTKVSFRNGKENIVVITSFMCIRGRNVDTVYIDHSFDCMRERNDFLNRFFHLDITPTTIREKQ